MGCGICGFVGISDRDLLKSMCESIRHRGPDDTGFYVGDNVGLGIDRLSIIDLVSGNQPIHNEDESIWTVFNGEIYNYRDLRKELESCGHRFYTESDTEVLVHGYEQWGDNCAEHLRGMFAFATWDSRRKRLYLARDRFGKKPLFYAILNGLLLFGSEIKAILRYDGIERKLQSDAVDYFFTYMYIPSPLTIFEGIWSLPPGSFASFESQKLTVKQYWDMRFAPNASLSEDAIVDLLYKSLEDAVRVRMRSDVPLGAFLSGGIDSSAVVSLMTRLSTSPVKTVSIGFEGGVSELPYSRLVAEHLGTDHKEYVVTPSAYKVLPRLIWHFDEPFADHSMIPTFYLSEVTRKEVTVALSGDGGDEMFMGYGFMNDPSSYGVYSKLPTSIRRPALKLIRNFPLDSQLKRMADHAYEKGYGDQSAGERYAMRVSLYDRQGLLAMYSDDYAKTHSPIDTYSLLTEMIDGNHKDDTSSAIDYATIRTYLLDDILPKVDRMSMAVSLEVRCPLLDQELASLVASIPSRLKLRGRTTKYIFRRMVTKKGLMPSEIVRRKKQGFGAPLESWMGAEWKDVVSQVLDPILSGRSLPMFNRDSIRKLVASPYIHSNKLFALMVFVLWHKMYIEQSEPRMMSESEMF